MVASAVAGEHKSIFTTKGVLYFCCVGLWAVAAVAGPYVGISISSSALRFLSCTRCVVLARIICYICHSIP
jgi:hypothetical protein